LDIGLGEVGILGSVFFWCYAAGQIINGQLGSIVRPHWIVFSGLLLISAANIGFAFQTSLMMMAILWGVNGFAQSMGWGPMLRILSSYTTEGQKRRLATIFSMSFQVGTAVAWGLASALIGLGGYRLAFLAPGLILLLAAAFWRINGLDAERVPSPRQSVTLSDIYEDVRRLFPMLMVATAIGFVYVGFLIWLPTFIQSWDFLPSGLDSALTAIVPLVGIPGMLLSGKLLARQSSLSRTTIQLLIGLFLSLVMSAALSEILQMLAVLMAVVFASGLAGLLLSAAPMLLVPQSRVSSAGGLLTSVWSVSGGLAGAVVGSVAEDHGWTMVFNLWTANTLVAILVVLIASRWLQGQTRSQGEN
jgi:OPA family glycerol-3-phosphate transporter-like MFS transporter